MLYNITEVINMVKYTDAEKQLLKKVGKPNFRALSKDDFMSIFESSLEKFSPEVQKAIIEQFPNLANVQQTLSEDYTHTESSILDKDERSANRVYDMYQKQMDTYNKELEREDLTEEQRNAIFKKQEELLEKAAYVHKQGQEFNKEVLAGKRWVVGAIMVSGLTALGYVAKRKLRK